MKKIIALAVILFFVATSFAQVPRGTYVPKNDMAKQSNWTKFEFTGGNKVKAYIGAMGVTVACYEYIYTLNGNNLSLSVAGQNGSAEGYTYNKVTDEISLHAGAFGTEGAIWHKAGATNNNNVTNNTTTVTKPTAQAVKQEPKQISERSVYVVTAGYYDGDDSDYYYDSNARKQHWKSVLTPKLWNDGKIQNLSIKNSGSAFSVFVSGDDVYIAGEQNGYATLWKNGVIQQLTKEQGGVANSVYVYGNDVYVVGNDNYYAILWKNGVPQNLTDGKSSACANSVFVTGGDVYVAGIVEQVAKLWINGVAQTLTGGNGANSVFVAGKDVYVAGSNYDDGAAILWKNGTPNVLAKGKNFDPISAHSVFVAGNDVYVAGSTEGYQAKLWKNGVEQKLTNKSGSAAYSVFVSGNDVYVAGWEEGYATLWKNGVAQRICNVGSVFATSVFVKEAKKECDTKPDIASIKYIPELAKRCALFSALAYQETRITTKSDADYLLGKKPSPTSRQSNTISIFGPKNEYFITNLAKYKELKDKGEILYFTGKRNDGYVKNDDDTPYVLHAELKYNGYEGIVSRNYHDRIEDNISYTFAYKKGNGNDIGFAVILRGTDSVEWRGNMKIWENESNKSERHYSFQKANEELQKAVKAYLDYLRNKPELKNKNIHLLITGHSRGAAVANLLAADLNEGAICGIKSLVAYTFATPNNKKNPNKTYNNIFNFCFDDDFVPQVPLDNRDNRFPEWDYGKSGETRTVCIEEFYNKGKANLSKDNVIFIENIIDYIQLSYGTGRKPDFNNKSTQDVLKDFYKLAPNVKDYYTKERILITRSGFGGEYRITTSEFMMNGVANAAINGISGVSYLISAFSNVFSDFHKVARFFVDGSNATNGKYFLHSYINDTHQAFTYYYALSSNGFKLK